MAVDDSTVLRTLLKRLWRARRASPFSPGPAIFSQLPLTFIHTIPYTRSNAVYVHIGPSHSLISFRTARRQIAPSNAFAARRHVRRITSLPNCPVPTPPCVKLKPPTNPNQKHVSHRRTSPQTLKFPSCQIGSARLDAPSTRHAHVRRHRCTFAAQHAHPAAIMPQPNGKTTVRRRVDLDRWTSTNRTTTIVATRRCMHLDRRHERRNG